MIGHPKNGLQLGGSNAFVRHANHCIKKGWWNGAIKTEYDPKYFFQHQHIIICSFFDDISFLKCVLPSQEIPIRNRKCYWNIVGYMYLHLLFSLKKRTTVQTSKLIIWLLVCFTIYDSKSVEFHLGFYCWEITKIQVLQSENFRSVT